jgi:hypothetical protein
MRALSEGCVRVRSRTSRRCNAGNAHREAGARKSIVINTPKNALRNIKTVKNVYAEIRVKSRQNQSGRGKKAEAKATN